MSCHDISRRELNVVTDVLCYDISPANRLGDLSYYLWEGLERALKCRILEMNAIQGSVKHNYIDEQ